LYEKLTFSFELHQTGGTIAPADLLSPENRQENRHYLIGWVKKKNFFLKFKKSGFLNPGKSAKSIF